MLRNRKETVPACRECNSLLGRTYQPTLEERKRYLKSILEKRYQRFLEIPDWDDDIADLGEQLKQYIKNGLEIKRVVQERLKW